MYCAVLSRFSLARLFIALLTIARQAPLSMGFSRQEYWTGLPCPSPGDLLDPGVKPKSLPSPTWEGGFFTTSATWEDLQEVDSYQALIFALILSSQPPELREINVCF